MPSPLQLPDDPVISYVIPLALTSRGDGGDWRLEEIAGTGFLVAEGRGLGVTAHQIAHNLERGTAAAVFAQADGTWRAVQILKFEQHPVEDVALFRLPADDYYSPFSVVASQHYSSAEYSVWGYPEDEHHDRMAAGGQQLSIPVDQDLLRGLLRGRFVVGAFDELAVLELRAGADQCHEMGCVDRPPA